jgi:hypothetical protein
MIAFLIIILELYLYCSHFTSFVQGSPLAVVFFVIISYLCLCWRHYNAAPCIQKITRIPYHNAYYTADEHMAADSNCIPITSWQDCMPSLMFKDVQGRIIYYFSVIIEVLSAFE